MQHLDALEAALQSELSLPTTARMLAAFGGTEICLSRFLEARGHNVEDAAAMFRATACFRRENGLDDDTYAGPSDELQERMGRFWPGTYSGFSAENSPVMFFRLGAVDVRRAVEAATEEEIKLFYLHWMERGLALQREGSARAAAAAPTHPGPHPAGDRGDATALSSKRGMIEVYDMAGLAVASISIPGVRLFASVLGLGQAHYPENLRKCFIVNAPLGFQSCAGTKNLRPPALHSLDVCAC